MAIYEKDFKNLLKYQDYLNEMAISDEEIAKHDTFIRNITDIKNNIKELNINIDNLKTIITNDIIRLKKEDEDDSKIYYKIIYPKKAYNIFIDFQDILVQSEDIDNELYRKYFNIIYPNGEEIDLDTEIEIEKNNFNRIHIPIGLPKIIQGIGIGKKIYLTLINKLKYISTTKLDRSLDAIFIWDSLRKDNTIYSFIKKEQMLCIDINYDYDSIIDLLLEFFKYEIEDLKNDINNHQHIIDSDFKEKYFSQILKTDIKYLIS